MIQSCRSHYLLHFPARSGVPGRISELGSCAVPKRLRGGLHSTTPSHRPKPKRLLGISYPQQISLPRLCLVCLEPGVSPLHTKPPGQECPVLVCFGDVGDTSANRNADSTCCSSGLPLTVHGTAAELHKVYLHLCGRNTRSI
ncbi:uncharacterized protein ACIBXB_019446 [Morphnus guianensis]